MLTQTNKMSPSSNCTFPEKINLKTTFLSDIISPKFGDMSPDFVSWVK